jgi:hypothetical protein
VTDIPDEWDRILETFPRPWKIKHRKDGGYRVEDKNGRVLVYVYPQGRTQDFKRPSDEEALTIVRAIAKMSRRK